MSTITFAPTDLPPETEALRTEVREFLRETLGDYPPVRRAESWSGLDPAFSRRLGERGWIGMTWPRRYGGHERSAFERYVVCEELLAAGAPVAWHWIGDRQSGPLLLRFGNEHQRELVLPGIARGELCFCIGMSEPDSGSDLASLRSRATRVEGGWRLDGRKVWTSNAHHAQYMIGLFRTRPPDPEHRHEGLSQFLIDMRTPGISLRPIPNMLGEHHFNEVTFDGVFLPGEMLIGEEGDGWRQVTAELAFERSGPERYLSSHELLVQLVERLRRDGGADRRGEVELGRVVARLASLRRMSVAVAGELEAGRSPLLESAVVKVLGVELEQAMPRIAGELAGGDLSLVPGLGAGEALGGDFAQVLAYVSQAAVSYSLRGGTPEVMRGIIARGLGLR